MCATRPHSAARRARDQRDRHDGHPRDLRDGHQRNRQEVQRESGEGHAREHQRADRKQHRLRGRRRRQERHSAHWIEAEARFARVIPSGPTRRNAKRGAKREHERRIGDRQRARQRRAPRPRPTARSAAGCADRSARPPKYTTAISVARSTDAPPPTRPRTRRARRWRASIAVRPRHPATRNAPSSRPARIAMLPPEMAMTWYVPASCSRRCTSSSSPARSPMTMAVTMAADCGLHRPTAAAIARRENARTSPTPSLHQRPARDDLDERAALDRADERRAAPRQRAFVVGHARIEIAGRPVKLHRHPDSAAGPPVVDARRGQRSDDGQGDPARRLPPFALRSLPFLPLPRPTAATCLPAPQSHRRPRSARRLTRQSMRRCEARPSASSGLRRLPAASRRSSAARARVCLREILEIQPQRGPPRVAPRARCEERPACRKCGPDGQHQRDGAPTRGTPTPRRRGSGLRIQQREEDQERGGRAQSPQADQSQEPRRPCAHRFSVQES